jgi:transglutaminase-like putative cysteine protease
MTILTVRHITTYQYKQPVSFGEHWMMLRPRESHDQRLLESKLEITPKPTNLRWVQDAFGNHLAIARFAGRAEALRFDITIRLDHSPADIVDMDIEDLATPDTMPGVFRLRANSGPPQNGRSPLIVTRRPERTWG